MKIQMNRIIVVFCFLMVSVGCFAQSERQNFVSTSQTGGRFEVIQSPIARRLTFRLDKYTGKVYQYVLSNDDESIWKIVSNPWLQVLHDKDEKNDYVRFQLFMSGIAVADCFLLDMETGITFMLYEDSNSGSLFFRYMKDPDLNKEE